MELLFPHHPCVLAREANSLRCASLKEANDERCAACRFAMQGLVWDALMEGDRSLAEFLLADDALTNLGFSVGEYRGASSGEPVFGLVRSATHLFTAPGDCAITPLPNGGFSLCLTIDDNHENRAACETLTQAIAWVAAQSDH